MKKLDIIRAWKNPVYRDSLSAEELASFPAHPAGLAELTDEELKKASGLRGVLALTTIQTCTEFTFRNWRACCPRP